MASKVRILALDSSGADLSTALASADAGVLGDVLAVTRSGAQSHDEGMASALDEIFLRAATQPQSVSAVVVGSGPGSFTGLRISLAFAKGLSFSLKIPLILVPSALGAAASLWAQLGPGFERVLVVAKAGKDQYFLSEIDAQGFPHAACAPMALSGAETVSRAQSAKNAACVCLDPMVRSELSGLTFSNIAPLNLAEGLLKVCALRVQASGLDALLKEFAYSVESCAAAEPNYLRSVAAKTIAERAAGLR